jgi:hypothetical protein
MAVTKSIDEHKKDTTRWEAPKEFEFTPKRFILM